MSNERISKRGIFNYFLSKVTNVHVGEFLGVLLEKNYTDKNFKYFLNMPNVFKLLIGTVVRMQVGML